VQSSEGPTLILFADFPSDANESLLISPLQLSSVTTALILLLWSEVSPYRFLPVASPTRFAGDVANRTSLTGLSSALSLLAESNWMLLALICWTMLGRRRLPEDSDILSKFILLVFIAVYF
jgi:hypothetical protein